MNLFNFYLLSTNPLLFILFILLILLLFVGLIVLSVYIGVRLAIKKTIVSAYIVNNNDKNNNIS